MAYSVDYTGVEEFRLNYYRASGTASGYSEWNVFDDSLPDEWGTDNAGSRWIEAEFASAEKINRVRVHNYDASSYAASQIIIKASNTGNFSGEETTLYTSSSGMTWSDPEWKTFDFENELSFVYYRLYFTSINASLLIISEIEMMEDLGEPEGAFTDGAGLNDSISGFSLTDEISDGVGLGDSLSVEVEPYAQIDAVGIGDSVDSFNWTEWQRINSELAVRRFYLTITGSGDGTTDIEIPMASFQARKRSANPTYLSVVVPYTSAAAEAITDRANGEIVIEMAYLIDGVESIREEILRADLEQINIQEGPSSRSINLIGHKTVTYANQEAILDSPSYKYTSDGRLGFRFPVPDPYLNPGDTAVVGDDSFTVDAVVYLVSAGSGQTVMEVQE